MVPTIALATPVCANNKVKLARPGPRPAQGTHGRWPGPFSPGCLCRGPPHINDGFFGLFVQIVGDHRAITLFQSLHAALDGFAGEAEAANLAFLFSCGRVS
jgi:hypothetical protein